MIDRKHDLSITKQAEVLQISRGSTVGDRFGYGAHDETLMHLASAAHASHPEWVIRLAMHQASRIMDANQAGHYGLATQWLEKAALAHEVLGHEDDWRACLDELIDRHRRKYKLPAAGGVNVSRHEAPVTSPANSPACIAAAAKADK
jgi:hypothetical protein